MGPMKYAGSVLLALVVGCGQAVQERRAPGTGGEGGGAGDRAADAGAAGRGGTGGARLADAATPAPGLDAASSSPDLAPAASRDADLPRDASAAEALPPVPACPKPSVDRLEVWTAHGGSLRPGVGGNLLVKEGDRYHVRVEFLPGSVWHEVVVPIANALSRKADLSASKGFSITYSATADLWVQLRPLTHPHGGEQHTAKLPSTGGAMMELFVPFDAASWGDLLGKPTFPLSEAVMNANFFNFVGPPGTGNTVVIRGLRFDGYLPPCS
jgi:hypothetical protein